MNKTFIESTNEFILETTKKLDANPFNSGVNIATVLLKLKDVTERLESVMFQANGQFNCGDKYATFSEQTINALNDVPDEKINNITMKQLDFLLSPVVTKRSDDDLGEFLDHFGNDDLADYNQLEANDYSNEG